MATDFKGQIWGFKKEPSYYTESGGWQSADNWFVLIGTVVFFGDWKKSMEKI